MRLRNEDRRKAKRRKSGRIRGKKSGRIIKIKE